MKLRGVMPSAQRPRRRVAISRRLPRRVLQCCSSRRVDTSWPAGARCVAAGGDVRPGVRRRSRRPGARRGRRRAPASTVAASGGYPSPASQRRTARRASGRAARGERPGRRSGRASPAAASASARSSATSSAVRTSSGDDVAAGDRRPSAGAARGGRGCARSGGSSLDGSSTGVEPEVRRTAARSRRGAGRAAGGVGAGPIAASPSRPAPRSRLISIVSARSSAVWPVRAPGGQGGQPGGAGPGLEVRARRRRSTAPSRKATPSVGGEAAGAARPRRAETGRSPWSTWTAVTWQPAAAASTSERRRVGAAGEGAVDARCPAGGTSSGPAGASIAASG